MNKNKNKKSSIKMYVVCCFIGYILLLFFSCHFCKVYDKETMTFFEAVQPAFTHIETSPFDIFPINWDGIKVASLISLFGVAYLYINNLNKKKMRRGEEHGSADWNNDIKKYNKEFTYPKGKTTTDLTPGNKNMILSNDIYLSMNGNETRRNCNILVAGGSGSGKSRFIVKPNILQANSSFVVTDPKGELLRSTASFLKKQGYEIKLFNLVDFEHSNRYNPFAYIRDEKGVAIMVNTLIKNTNGKGSTSSDPFWEKAETSLLLAICYYLYYECEPEDRNFSNVLKLINIAQVKEEQEEFQSPLDLIFENLRLENPEHIAVSYYDIFKMGAGKTLKSILISAGVRLGSFLTSLHYLTEDDNIHLEELGNKKCALFVVIPDSDATFNFLVAMMYSQLFETLYYCADHSKNGKLNNHVRFLLDEFANIGEIPDFEKKLATMRSREISCTIIIQNIAQLKTMYKDNWESITGNCDTFIFLGGQEQSTLEYVSKKLGKQTIITRSNGQSKGKSGSSSTNYQSIGRDLVTADELGTMPNNTCIVLIRGIRPFLTKKYDYPLHQNYKYTEDSNTSNAFYYENNFDTHSKNEVDKVGKSAIDNNIHNTDKANVELVNRQNEFFTQKQSAQGTLLLVPEDVTIDNMENKSICLENDNLSPDDITIVEEKTDEFGGYDTEFESDFLEN